MLERNLLLKQHQALLLENDTMRAKIAKMNEVEAYVEALLNKLEATERKGQEHIYAHNSLLKQMDQLQQARADAERLHADQMRTVFSEHERETQTLLQAIDTLERKLVLAQETSRALLDEADQLKKAQLEANKYYEGALHSGRQDLARSEHRVKELQTELEREKFQKMTERENILSEQNLLRVELKEKTAKLNEAYSENRSLSNQKVELLRNLDSYEQQLSVLRADHERTSSNLQSCQSELRQRQDELAAREREISALENEINSLEQKLKGLSEQCYSSVTDNQKLAMMLESSDHENSFLAEKLHATEETLQSQINRLSIEILSVKQRFSVVESDNTSMQRSLASKVSEIKDLLSVVDRLEVNLSERGSQCNQLTTQLDRMTSELQSTQRKCFEQQITTKSLQEKLNLYTATNTELQGQNESIKRQCLQQQTEIHKLTRQLSNPREMNKELQAAMDRLTSEFNAERESMMATHQQQKNQLRSLFEYESNDRELHYRRKMEELNGELEIIKKTIYPKK